LSEREEVKKVAIVKLKTQITEARPAAQAGVRSLEDVQRLASQAGLSGPPFDVHQLAALLGIEVIFEQMHDDMSGYLERRGERWVMGVNSFHHRVRQRFTMAHELAHFALHRQDSSRFDDVTFSRRNNDPSRMEREADQFAAELLMPEAQVLHELDKGLRGLNDLAHQFDVSSLAMRYRLESLGYKLT
jgi:Zn-dependent peptidase ImmA (M78 family)